jgi:hypothetical protein
VVAGAVVGHALPRRHLDTEVGLVALGAKPRAAQCSLRHVGLLLRWSPSAVHHRRCDLGHMSAGPVIGRTSVERPDAGQDSRSTMRQPAAGHLCVACEMAVTRHDPS